MAEQKVQYSLRPWPGGPWPSGLAVQVRLRREAGLLTLEYELAGSLTALALPEPVPEPRRRDGLWCSSCFEFFLAPVDDPGYWEFNISPAGHWNCFCFSEYRQGMREETRVEYLAVRQRRAPDRLVLAVTQDLQPLLPPRTSCRLGLAAVLRDRDGHISYWAPGHPGERPDFHHPAGFLPCV